MDPIALLTELASELWTQAHQHAPEVLRLRSPSAAPDPFGPLVFAQRASSSTDYQLPEPILHPLDTPVVLVVGLNPGYGTSEVIPRLGTPLSDYVAWYANRFDSSRRDDQGSPLATYLEGGQEIVRPVPHYAKIERLLDGALGPRPLGRNAVYADAIPWKWNNSVKELRPHISLSGWDSVWRTASTRVRTIVEALRPTVVITLGEPGAWIFGRSPSASPRCAPATLGDWTGVHLPSAHPNARGKTGAYWAEATQAIREAVRPAPV